MAHLVTVLEVSDVLSSLTDQESAELHEKYS